MKIEIDIHSVTQLRAFATFINTLTEERENEVRKKLAYGEINSVDTTGALIGRSAAMNELAQGIVTGAAIVNEQANTTTAPTRKRGEPSPGHKRRTKAEIAEDERAEEAEMKAKMDSATQAILAETQKGLAAISTGGERVAPDDTPEVEQQDVADEADETAKAGAELSHDDVRNAMGQYVTKFGMDAAQIDIPKVFQLALKDTAVNKVSLIPGDQASLKKAVDGVMEMLAKNPFQRIEVA